MTREFLETKISELIKKTEEEKDLIELSKLDLKIFDCISLLRIMNEKENRI